MNVKLAVVLAVACLFLAGVCFATDNNAHDNDKDFDRDDKYCVNKRVVVTWGAHGGKVRVHGLLAPRKWIQISHVSVQELTKDRAPVYLKDSKGKSSKNLRAVNLQNTDFTWSTPTVVDGGEGRTVDAYLRTQFIVAGISVKVIFRVNVVQENSAQVLNGVTLRREVDDVQFSLDVVDWPFESDSNILDWQFYVQTNYDAADKKTDGVLTNSKLLRVNGVPGTGVVVFKEAALTYPNNAQVDGVNKPCVSEVTNLDNKGDFTLDVYFPKAAHHLFYNAIVKMINLPPASGGDTGGGTGSGCSALCLSNPCLNGGTCATSTLSSTCIPSCVCPAGYSGGVCQNAPDPCTPNPCHGGTCTANGAQFACTSCPAGYSGTTCQTAIPCYNNGNCVNGGTCNPSDGSCTCQDPYGGSDCSVNLCANVVCKNSGTCHFGSCSCTTGWSGTDCGTALNCGGSGSTNPCPAACHGHGDCSCSNTDNSWSCACYAGYTSSPDCSVGPCGSNPCQNGGSCTNAPDGSNAFSCTCAATFSGLTCGTYTAPPPPPPCASNPCAHGSCANAGTDYVCSCPVGWLGKNCDVVDQCVPNPCQNSGTCASSPSDPSAHCTCPTGFIGANCETSVCANACLNGGSCTATGGSGFTCTCTPQWQGPTCNAALTIDVMSVPAATAPKLDYTSPPPTPIVTGPFGYFQTGNVLLVMYPQYGALRLYDTTGVQLTSLAPGKFHTSSVELDQTTADFINTADYIQLTQDQLIETDSALQETAKTFAIDGGFWQYPPHDQQPDPAKFTRFIYFTEKDVKDIGHFTFELDVDLYTVATKLNVVADGTFDPVFIDIADGAVKFTVNMGPWPWTETDPSVVPFLKWVTYLQTRSDVYQYALVQALPDGVQKRFSVPQGTLDVPVLAGSAICDGSADFCPNPMYVEQQYSAGTGTAIAHYFPKYDQSFRFDPVLQLHKPGEPDYPPWVDATAGGGASVIRDPRSQFQGAATLQTSAIAVVLAVVAAAFAAHV